MHDQPQSAIVKWLRVAHVLRGYIDEMKRNKCAFFGGGGRDFKLKFDPFISALDDSRIKILNVVKIYDDTFARMDPAPNEGTFFRLRKLMEILGFDGFLNGIRRGFGTQKNVFRLMIGQLFHGI